MIRFGPWRTTPLAMSLMYVACVFLLDSLTVAIPRSMAIRAVPCKKPDPLWGTIHSCINPQVA